nr:alpha/beta fold hydrolase [Nonomuraea terrae]
MPRRHHKRHRDARIGPAILIGHSLGAINAYQLAARRPDLVRAFVAVDFPVEAGDFTNPWLDQFPERLPTLEPSAPPSASRC